MKKILFTALVLWGVSAYAADPVYFGEVGFGGSGCRPEETTVRLSSGRRVLRLHFGNYNLESSGRLEVKSCGVAIPVHVPKGVQVAVIPAELSGFASVDSDSIGQVNIETFFAGTQGEVVSRDLKGVTGHFKLRSLAPSGEAAWSGCGEDTILRVNTRALTRASGDESASQVAINSAALFQIRTRKCQQAID